jgi:hypothetical protein
VATVFNQSRMTLCENSDMRKPAEEAGLLPSDERPDTWVTVRTGHMGNTFPPQLRGKVSMPWKESSVTDERLRSVARLLEGEQMSPLCRKFGISRMAGYKIDDR